MSELTDEQLKELARTIWHASRADEGTISAAGADIVAAALAPVVTEMLAEARAEAQVPSVFVADDHEECVLRERTAAARALRIAAKEAEERGDIGKEGGYEAWTWLRIRANQIADAE